MCGFVGVIAFDPRYRTTPDVLAKMSACVAHRGPDGQGVHLDEHEPSAGRPQAALAHVRLAILDPDPRSDQPFAIGDKLLLFNGEIYNFPDLRKELTQLRPDHQWRTTGDTETLLLAYDTWREACLPKLDGMFAFVVWDASQTTAFLARDRTGQKPLYYAIAPDHGAIAFASELGALRKLPWLPTTLDQTSLCHYLSWGYVPAPRTIYTGASKLPHSHWLRFPSTGQPTQSRYFDVNSSNPQSAIRNPQSTTRDLLTAAVRRQMISDVPLGCFLSGGIDSSVVASCMKAAARRDQKILTFSIGFDDPRYDETPYAREVAQHLGTTHHEFRVRPDAAADLPKLAEVFGEPFADSSALPTHYLARETRQHVKVALSGDGGDELFGGYQRYRAMAYAEHMKWVPGIMLGGVVLEQLPASHPKSVASHVRRFVKSLKLPAAKRYAAYMRLFDPPAINELLPNADETAMNWLAAEYERLHHDRDVVQTALALDRDTYLPEDLHTKVDRAAMLHALEVRSPFMDPALLNFAATLPTDLLIKGGSKRLLREAFAADLPPAVFRRRKMGFAVPVDDWFRTSLKSMLHDAIFVTGSFASTHLHLPTARRLLTEHDARASDHSQRLYALLMLELWYRTQSG